jgi:regulator of sigma E protease
VTVLNTAIITTLAALLVFGLLIITHELGHFIAAKLAGVIVLEFAIGMGPKILSFKRGNTKYTLRALPIGGYNKMLGEQEKSLDPKAFSNKSPWKRLLIILAGAFMNFITALVLFVLVVYYTGAIMPIVGSVESNYPAAKAGIMVNDTILKVNDKEITNWNEFTDFIASNNAKPFDIVVKRGNKNVKISIKPINVFVKEENTYKYMIGISLGSSPNFTNVSLGQSIKSGLVMTRNSISLMLNFISTALRGKLNINDVGGPLTIVKLSGKIAQDQGILRLLYFIAFLSVNLGVMNLIPFPALDGGWVIILLYEGITGRRIKEDKIGIVNFIGFVFLIGLIILVTFKDIFGPKMF